MTLSDILSFFSANADGQRMTGQPVGILNQIPQAQVVQPATAARIPQRPAARPQPPLLPLQQTEINSLPPVASVMAEESAAPAPIPASMSAVAQEPVQQAPQQAPMAAAMGQQEQPGVLSRLFDNSRTGVSPFEYAMRALGAAGSQDPMKTAMQFAAQDSEDGKLREARRRANQPKVEPIAGTPFSRITMPDGSFRDVPSEALAAYYKSQSESKANQKIEDAVLQDRLARGRDASKADIKAGEEAKPLLNDIQGLKGRWAQAKEIVSGQGTMAQVQGIPGIAGIAGFFGGDEVAKNKFLQGLTVDETLLNTARTKGAISNTEMMLFKSPIPSLSDDREKVWKPWIEQRLEVLDKLEKYYAGEAGRSSGGQAAPAAEANQPPPSAIKTQATAAFGSYEPDKYEYGINPQTKKFARRLKGQ